MGDGETNALLVGLAKALASPTATAAWARAVSQEELETAWQACPDARALFRLCAPVTSAKVLVRSACACLRHALAQTKHPAHVRAAVAKLEAWARGEGAWREVDVIGEKIVLGLGGSESDVVNALVAAASIPEDRTRAMDVVVEVVKALAEDGSTYNPSFARHGPRRATKAAVLAELADIVRAVVPCPRVDDLARGA
jgi:hypothetical protein